MVNVAPLTCGTHLCAVLAFVYSGDGFDLHSPRVELTDTYYTLGLYLIRWRPRRRLCSCSSPDAHFQTLSVFTRPLNHHLKANHTHKKKRRTTESTYTTTEEAGAYEGEKDLVCRKAGSHIKGNCPLGRLTWHVHKKKKTDRKRMHKSVMFWRPAEEMGGWSQVAFPLSLHVPVKTHMREFPPPVNKHILQEMSQPCDENIVSACCGVSSFWVLF